MKFSMKFLLDTIFPLESIFNKIAYFLSLLNRVKLNIKIGEELHVVNRMQILAYFKISFPIIRSNIYISILILLQSLN